MKKLIGRANLDLTVKIMYWALFVRRNVPKIPLNNFMFQLKKEKNDAHYITK